MNTVFQHYALFPHMDVARNVGYGLRQVKVGKDEETRRVAEALALVRLSGYERRRTWEMSGGQQQRVALARALVNHPTVLLLDEPLGALDLKLRKEMQLELKALQREVGITFVYVTHDQEEALTMSDVIVVMRDGLIQQMGGPTELYERPVNRFVADFIGTSNFVTGAVDIHRRERPHGHRPERTGPDPARHGHRSDRDVRPGPIRRPSRCDRSGSMSPRPMPASTETGWSSVMGRINQGTYLGDQTEFRVQTDQAGELDRPSPERHGGGCQSGSGTGGSGPGPLA